MVPRHILFLFIKNKSQITRNGPNDNYKESKSITRKIVCILHLTHYRLKFTPRHLKTTHLVKSMAARFVYKLEISPSNTRNFTKNVFKVKKRPKKLTLWWRSVSYYHSSKILWFRYPDRSVFFTNRIKRHRNRCNAPT